MAQTAAVLLKGLEGAAAVRRAQALLPKPKPAKKVRRKERQGSAQPPVAPKMEITDDVVGTAGNTAEGETTAGAAGDSAGKSARPSNDDA